MTDDLVARLRAYLGSTCQDASGGDNLAILLASYFEPSIENDELDDSGTWKQGAIDACNRVLDAIHAHYAPSLESAEARVRELEAALATVRAECVKTSNSYLARAEAAERELAEAYERAAKVAETHSFGRDIDWWLHATKKEVSAEACPSVAAAIRKLGQEGMK